MGSKALKLIQALAVFHNEACLKAMLRRHFTPTDQRGSPREFTSYKSVGNCIEHLKEIPSHPQSSDNKRKPREREREVSLPHIVKEEVEKFLVYCTFPGVVLASLRALD